MTRDEQLRAIAAFLAEHPGATRQDVGDALGLSRGRIGDLITDPDMRKRKMRLGRLPLGDFDGDLGAVPLRDRMDAAWSLCRDIPDDRWPDRGVLMVTAALADMDAY